MATRDENGEDAERQEVTVREAGRRGGSKVRDKYGKEFYKQIGQKGGTTTWETHGKEFYQKIGKMGGTKGGKRLRELIEKGKQLEAEEK